MHRRVWFIVAAVAALLGLAGSAAAMTAGSSSSSSRVLAAAPFAKSWASTPRTPAARAAKKTMVFGMEQDVTGFNLSEADETAYWAALTGETPVIRGNYIIDNKGNYKLDLASSVVATKSSLTIKIKKSANWFWQGHKATPVTASDYIYTWKQFMDPKNNVASTTGYSNIASAHGSGKHVTFVWKKSTGPFADYRDLFGYIYPGFALKGQSFNTFWLNCVCGNDGKPITDGPYYISNYTRGQGLTLKANKSWFGAKPQLSSVVFKLITDTNSEIQAMRGGEVDAISPSPQTALAPLVHQSGLTYSSIGGFTQEHWDIGNGPGSNPLLHHTYMRQAIMLGMNRGSLIKALYSQIAPSLKSLNNPNYEIGPLANGKYGYFSKFNYAPKKAIALLKKNCTGGPSSPSASNTKIWTCGGQKADFRFFTTAGNQRRATSAQVFQAQLKAIGIQIDPSFQPANPNFFGQTLPSANFDLAEYAWVGGPDPSGFDAIYQCFNANKNLGGQNYKRYCNHKVDSLIKKGDGELNVTKRTADYENAAKIIANAVPIIPLYSTPQILVFKSKIKGMNVANNPTSEGPTWNIQAWHWS
jgi:peptide/nickel transport system substrate-binding protein